jgi:hypothetical protein
LARWNAGEPLIAALGPAPDRAALAAALASVAEESDVHEQVAYLAAQRWPRVALEVMLPRADPATLDRLLTDGGLAFERQTPMPSKMVFVAEPLELHKVPDGTGLTVRGAADDALIDAVVRAAGPALVELRFMHDARSGWSEPGWRGLDRSVVRRLRCWTSSPEMVRSLLDGASGIDELHVTHDALDDDRVPDTLRSLRLEGTRDTLLRASLARALARCPWLTRVWIDAACDAAAITALASLPLVELTLWKGRFGDDGARAVARCRTLEEVIVRGGTIGDDGAEALAALPAVRRLWLDRNRVGARGAAAIAAMTCLEDLQLDGNLIDDAGALALARLRGLRTLSLMENPIADPEALRPVLAAAAHDVSLVFGDRTDAFGTAY